MKGIVTARNADGTYDGVGMNNRTITGCLKTTQGIRNNAFRFAESLKRTGVEIEFFPAGRIYGTPFSVEEWEREALDKPWKQIKKLGAV